MPLTREAESTSAPAARPISSPQTLCFTASLSSPTVKGRLSAQDVTWCDPSGETGTGFRCPTTRWGKRQPYERCLKRFDAGAKAGSCRIEEKSRQLVRERLPNQIWRLVPQQ